MIDDYDYYQCPPEIASEIDNWRRWLIGGGGGVGGCQSIEGRYRSTDVFEGQQARIEVNILEAVEIEKIVRQLPKKNKAALKAYHIHRLPTHIMRRKLGERDIGCLMRNSWAMVKNNLDKRRKQLIMATTAEPSTDETIRREAA
ncbi:MAG TPA: hypothetical protein VIY48_21520 [Candidatus Paceibacterota bacterium]